MVYLGKPPFQQLCNTHPFYINNINTYNDILYKGSSNQTFTHTYYVIVSSPIIVIFTNWGNKGITTDIGTLSMDELHGAMK
jgi:hypothetical protein